jgi:transposase
MDVRQTVGRVSDIRQQRGIELADKVNIRRIGKGVGGERGMWVVPSATGSGKYTVDLDGVFPTCTCPDHEQRLKKCKHIYAAEVIEERFTKTKTKTKKNGDVVVTETVKTTKRTTYRQDWPAYNAAQTTEKASFQVLLHDLCTGIREPPQIMGRPRLSYADMVFTIAFKVYSTFSGRRFMTDLKSAHEKGYLSKLPHHTAIFDYMAQEDITPILTRLIERSSLPLKAVERDFAVDSSGFSTCRTVTWFNTRYGHEQDKSDWLKLHLICGVKTNVVTGVMASDRGSNDSPFFMPLVERTAKNFTIGEVSADRAYNSRKNLKQVDRYGGTGYIPFKAGTKDVGSCDIWRKMFHLFHMNRDEFLSHYHKRSNVESTFSMIKAKFGPALRSKTDTAMENEALCKVLCHNICVLIQESCELGIDPTFKAPEKPDLVDAIYFA